MSLQYTCPGCGTPLGYEGLCWKCKCEQERNAALAWTPEQIAEKQRNLIQNIQRLAEMEEDPGTEGILILLNTLGGDVEAGLAIAEMIASLSKPTVSLVLGGSHSIGGPLAVSADYSFIVPTGTMIVHPVRSTGMFIGVIQSYRNMERTQDRIARFISDHSRISQERLVELMLDSTQLVKDVGTMLEGEDAVREGLIDEVGGISQAFAKLHEMIEKRRSSTAVQSNNREN